MSDSTDPNDLLLHMLLKELLGGESPPDVRSRVLEKLENEQVGHVLTLAEAAEQATSQKQTSPMRTSRRSRKVNRGLFLPLAMAALFLIGVGTWMIIFFNSNRSEPNSGLVVKPVEDPGTDLPEVQAPKAPTILFTNGDVKTNGKKSKPGQLAFGQRLRSRRGLAIVQYQDGSRVRMAPSTLLVAVNDQQSQSRLLELASGSLSVSVKPQAALMPFKFLTPEAEVSVVGTEFELSSKNKRTRIEVDKGSVDVTDLTDMASGKKIRVTAGQYVMCGNGMGIETGRINRANLRVESFTLIDADNHRPIPGYDPIPENAVIRYADLPTRNINVLINTHPAEVGSIRLDMKAPYVRTHTESQLPYSMPPGYLSTNEIFLQSKTGNRWTPEPGHYHLVATPYQRAWEAGPRGDSQSLTFEIRE